jgi:hypothetical protein
MEEELERARGYAQRAGDRRTMSWILGAMCRVTLLGPMPVGEGIRRCLAIQARHRGEPTLQPVVDSILAVLEAMRGRFASARDHYRRSHTAFDELGLSVQLAAFRMYAGWVELLADHPAVAEQELRAGYQALERMGEQSYLSTTAAFLARAVFSQGRYGEAEHLTRVSADSASEDDRITQTMWRGTRAKVLARRRDGDAERLARESVALSLETDCLNMQADALVDLAETLRLLDRGGETAEPLEQAIGLYEQKGNVVSASAVAALLGRAAHRG